MAKVSPIKNGYQKEIINLIKKAAYSKAESEVFCDWLEMAAISISNQFDFTYREARENRYLEIINSYEKKHQLFSLKCWLCWLRALMKKCIPLARRTY